MKINTQEIFENPSASSFPPETLGFCYLQQHQQSVFMGLYDFGKGVLYSDLLREMIK